MIDIERIFVDLHAQLKAADSWSEPALQFSRSSPLKEVAVKTLASEPTVGLAALLNTQFFDLFVGLLALCFEVGRQYGQQEMLDAEVKKILGEEGLE